MPRRSRPTTDARQSPRLKIPPMYSVLRARPQGQKKFCWTGHIYDVSAAGMRFELDSAIEPGIVIDVRATLPGPHHTTINASGHVVRYHDDADEPGPIRMGMIFASFDTPQDRKLLDEYLREHGLAQAA